MPDDQQLTKLLYDAMFDEGMGALSTKSGYTGHHTNASLQVANIQLYIDT